MWKPEQGQQRKQEQGFVGILIVIFIAIAIACGLERHVPSRRLPELRDQGMIVNGESRICDATGRLSMTWHPAKGGR